jgi:hypothetical protein
MHNDHYTKLAEYEPFKVYEAWARGNEELFKKHFTFGGYYLAALKYLARIESKDDPVKNLEKVAVYVQAMINILKDNQDETPTQTVADCHQLKEEPCGVEPRLSEKWFESTIDNKMYPREKQEDLPEMLNTLAKDMAKNNQAGYTIVEQTSSLLRRLINRDNDSLHWNSCVDRKPVVGSRIILADSHDCYIRAFKVIDETTLRDEDGEDNQYVTYDNWDMWAYFPECFRFKWEKEEPQADTPPPEPIEWHTHEEQPEKGRWIEWDGQKYVDDRYEGKKQMTVFREDNGNYTSYLWDKGRISFLKGFWDWEEMKHWGKWRYIDAPS